MKKDEIRSNQVSCILILTMKYLIDRNGEIEFYEKTQNCCNTNDNTRWIYEIGGILAMIPALMFGTYNEVDHVIYEAFSEQHGIETGKFMKQHFANERRKDTYIPELSLVAVLENEKIVGEVAIHETDIITDNGNITELTLSQYAVLPEYRKQGVMRMLIEEGLQIAKNMGYGAAFLGG